MFFILIVFPHSSPFRANEKGASRLCKAAMLHRFRDVMRMAGKFDMAEIPTYQEAKMACEEYQNVKQVRSDVGGKRWGGGGGDASMGCWVLEWVQELARRCSEAILYHHGRI